MKGQPKGPTSKMTKAACTTHADFALFHGHVEHVDTVTHVLHVEINGLRVLHAGETNKVRYLTLGYLASYLTTKAVIRTI